jgi:cytochrome c oxidase subunit II
VFGVQKIWSVLFGVVMLAALLLFVVAPWVGWGLPHNVSTFGGAIDELYFGILAVTGFFFVLTEVLQVYAMWHFRSRTNGRSQYSHGNHKLEMVWTIVPGVILLVIAIVQVRTWAEVKFAKNMPRPNAETLQMEVTARQWEWRVRYPSPARLDTWAKDAELAQDFARSSHSDDIQLTNEIHVWKGGAEPANRQNVLVHLRTLDVIHSFFLPNLRLKQDALPGKVIKVWFAVTEHNVEPVTDPKTGQKTWVEIGGLDEKTGKAKDPSKVWELACAEFCGARHSFMRGKLYVHKDKADFLDWLKTAQAEQNRYQPTAQTKVAAK